ncbi:hypothetical protein BCR32DRAFT_302049 [Anaeromyces robustus]|uniref:Uncharacterized protein n=1 Tax=Anaeromyces robustus TaxID=1754192 RepID=A0A1Y1WXA0_9FUNG|nr:hypothetical protein BCR32DRAFT_302049 [Anaeromyces robustus]|eukprot:ORX78171.1 hypothetical protein BCR32DRAFT_302049 [Anaeromyces robustus]
MIRGKRVNNKKNKRNKKKDNKEKTNQNNNNNNKTCKTNTSVSVMDYCRTLINTFDDLDIIYTNCPISEENFYFNEKFKQTIINVFKWKSDNPEHLTDAHIFTKLFNDEIQYWGINGRTASYFDNFNRIYYNENQFNNKKAKYPFYFNSLVDLYDEYNVYSEVVLMVSELLPSKIEFSRRVLFGRVIEIINLGPLQDYIEIPLEIPILNDYLNRYSFFLFGNFRLQWCFCFYSSIFTSS